MISVSPLSLSAPTVSCQFMKRGCQHGEVFQETYKRANRAHGVKILRCFPHCCPVHMPRSYCGGSLDLKVDGCDAPASQLRVYARLRPQQDTALLLREGDLVSKAALEAGVQSESNPTGQWIASVVRMPSELLHTTHQSLRFAISPSGRWYYPWLSGKSNGRRLTKHVLEAVVFVKHYAADLLRVVTLVQSPAFMVVSFRHSTGSDDSRYGISSLYDTPEYISLPSNSPPYRHMENETASTSPRSDSVSAIDFGMTLAAIFSLARTRPLRSVKNFIPKWMLLADGEAVNSVAPSVVEISSANSLIAHSPETAAIHLLWWLSMDRDTYQHWSRCVSSAAEHLITNRPALEHIYHQWMQWLQSHVSQYLNQLGGFTLCQVAQEITVNSHAHPFDWRCFIAQSREEVVNRTLRHHPDNAGVGGVWFCPFRNISVSHSTAELGKALEDLPISVLLAFWRLLGCVDLKLDTKQTSPELHVVSMRNGILPRNTFRIIIDNKYRWFNALPDGTSTLFDGQSGSSCCSHRFGDYVASSDNDGMVQVTMFAWPDVSTINQPDVSYRWLWRFRHQQLCGTRMEVDLSVARGQLSFREMTITNSVFVSGDISTKLAFVEEWVDEFIARLSYLRTSQ